MMGACHTRPITTGRRDGPSWRIVSDSFLDDGPSWVVVGRYDPSWRPVKHCLLIKFQAIYLLIRFICAKILLRRRCVILRSSTFGNAGSPAFSCCIYNLSSYNGSNFTLSQLLQAFTDRHPSRPQAVFAVHRFTDFKSPDYENVTNKTVVTCKIKHLQKCFINVLLFYFTCNHF